MRKKTALPVNCAECGKVVYKSPARLKRNKYQFCSYGCYWAHRRKRPKKAVDVCSYCHKEFYNKIGHWRAKKAKYGPFCSHKCYGKWRTENLFGKNSPNWLGGVSGPRGMRAWKKARKDAFERDGYQCAQCRKESDGRNLDVHHIVPVDFFNDPLEAHVFKNLVTMCRKCHAAEHKLTEAQLKGLKSRWSSTGKA